MSFSDPKDHLLSSYDYAIDNDLIAQVPIEPRHAAKLLIVENERLGINASRDAQVFDLKDELSPGDLLVLNDTRVLKARLRIRRRGGGLGELLVLEPRGNGKWLCLARPAKRLKPGDEIWLEALEQKPISLKVVSNDMESKGRLIQFPSCYSDAMSIEGLLERYGEVPLPPYIQTHHQNNSERYQTRYAVHPGAVAAPTAGLHLSDELLEALTKNGVHLAQITLHVGLGTFRPLEIENLQELKLHSEWVDVTEDLVKAVDACRSRGGKVIAIGTTSVRALEGAALAGDGKLKPLKGYVDLVIKPGYQFSVVDGLLTNFHLPKSSLLLLVSALIGRKRLLSLYEKAIKSDYRFFSYGDAMWIPPNSVLQKASRSYATEGS